MYTDDGLIFSLLIYKIHFKGSAVNFNIYVNFILIYTASSWTPDGTSTSDRKKKRKSRWAQDNDTDKTIIPGMPTVIPNGLSDDQEKQYLCKYHL